MSKRKRELVRQQKASLRQREDAKKKTHYSSCDWEEKKRRKEQSRIQRRISAGVPTECDLKSWENPSATTCKGCYLCCKFSPAK